MEAAVAEFDSSSHQKISNGPNLKILAKNSSHNSPNRKRPKTQEKHRDKDIWKNKSNLQITKLQSTSLSRIGFKVENSNAVQHD